MVPEMCDTNPVKTLLAIDATGSMSDSLKTTTTTLAEAFNRIYDFLKRKNLQSGFLVQLMVYRNYNCKAESILVETPFENTPKNLIEFISRIRP